jgi:hypothetical protein
MPEKLKPSKPKLRPVRWPLRRPTLHAFTYLSPPVLILFNLWLFASLVVLFKDGPRRTTLDDGEIAEVHITAALPALFGSILASAVMIVKEGFEKLRDHLWRRQITRELLDKIARDPGSMKLDGDGEIILDVEGELNRRKFRSRWRRPGWTYEYFWVSHGHFTIALGTAFFWATMSCLLYLYGVASLVFIHTPEVVVKLAVMIFAPQTHASEVDRLVSYAYVVAILAILMGVVAMIVKNDMSRRR